MQRAACSSRNSKYHISLEHSYSSYWDITDSKISLDKVEEADSLNTSAAQLESENPKILIQNKNQCNNADNTCPSQIILLAVEYCLEHSNLFLHQDEKLVKPGDKFDSHNDFIQYLNENAKRWYYYYKCSDSRKPNTENECYLYSCVYLRNKEKYVKKGLRKRINNLKTNCPCKIKLKRLPNEAQLTVVFVCNHHDHPLSEEEFYKLQHGRRLPPYIKEEIMDLLSMQVEVDKIKKYVQIQTGFSMNRTFFYQIERTMRLKKLERQVSEEKLMELSNKISNMELSINVTDGINLSHRRKYVRNMKRLSMKKCVNVSENNINNDNMMPGATDINSDIHKIINLQESLECETYKNPWNVDHYVLEFANSPENQIVNAGDKQNDYTLDDNYKISEQNENKADVIGDNYIAYETVVTEHGNEIVENHYTDLKANDELTYLINCENHEITSQEHGDIQWSIQPEEYANEEGKELSLCSNSELSSFILVDNLKTSDFSVCKVEINSSDNMNSAKSLLPEFDVQMEDENITALVVKDEIFNNVKQSRAEKSVQTNDDDNFTTVSNVCVNSLPKPNTLDSYIEQISSNTYQKHEYIHKYNIDGYLDRPHFLDYVKILSHEIQIDAKQMINNVHSEKAMFKMTTTQRDKEGDTRIWYMTIRFE